MLQVQAARILECELECALDLRPGQIRLLAKALLDEQWPAFEKALLLGATQTIRLPASVPVYVVYLTAEPSPSVLDGATYFRDIYKRDRAPPLPSK